MATSNCPYQGLYTLHGLPTAPPLLVWHGCYFVTFPNSHVAMFCRHLQPLTSPAPTNRSPPETWWVVSPRQGLSPPPSFLGRPKRAGIPIKSRQVLARTYYTHLNLARPRATARGLKTNLTTPQPYRRPEKNKDFLTDQSTPPQLRMAKFQRKKREQPVSTSKQLTEGLERAARDPHPKFRPLKSQLQKHKPNQKSAGIAQRLTRSFSKLPLIKNRNCRDRNSPRAKNLPCKE